MAHRLNARCDAEPFFVAWTDVHASVHFRRPKFFFFISFGNDTWELRPCEASGIAQARVRVTVRSVGGRIWSSSASPLLALVGAPNRHRRSRAQGRVTVTPRCAALAVANLFSGLLCSWSGPCVCDQADPVGHLFGLAH